MEQGNFFTRKVGPFPAWVWLAGAALLAYLYFRHSQGAGGGIAGSPTTTGGGGSITTGNTRVAKDAVRVTVNAKGTGNDDKDTDPDHHKHQHQPGPHHHKRHAEDWTTITVPANMTLEQLADRNKWSPDTLKDVESQKQPEDSSFKGKVLKGSQKLRKGQKVGRPEAK